MQDYSAWRRVWNRRPWQGKAAAAGQSFECSVLLADGREYAGTVPGPDSIVAMASFWRLVRECRTAANALPCGIADYAAVPVRGPCPVPMLYLVTRADPDRARLRVNAAVAAEVAAYTAARKGRAFTAGVQARLEAQESPIRWTEKELAAAESRQAALANMLRAEAAAVRRIKARMQKERERKAAER